MTCEASSWTANLTPSSEEKEVMGESVPEVKTMEWARVRSENAYISKNERNIVDINTYNLL